MFSNRLGVACTQSVSLARDQTNTAASQLHDDATYLEACGLRCSSSTHHLSTPSTPSPLRPLVQWMEIRLPRDVSCIPSRRRRCRTMPSGSASSRSRWFRTRRSGRLLDGSSEERSRSSATDAAPTAQALEVSTTKRRPRRQWPRNPSHSGSIAPPTSSRVREGRDRVSSSVPTVGCGGAAVDVARCRAPSACSLRTRVVLPAPTGPTMRKSCECRLMCIHNERVRTQCSVAPKIGYKVRLGRSRCEVVEKGPAILRTFSLAHKFQGWIAVRNLDLD